jgi:hypothetical protein
MLLMILASLDHLTNGRRPFGAALNAGSRIGDVGYYLVWEAFKNGSKRNHKRLRIGVLVSTI